MVDKALSDLTSVGSIDTGDIAYVVRNGNSRRVPIGVDFAAIREDIATLDTGKLSGPSVAVDNAMVRFDGVSGKLVQSSNVTVDDTGNITGLGYQEFDEIAVPSAPTNAGHVRVFAADTGGDTHLYVLDTGGVKRDLSVSTFWFRDATGKASVKNLLNESAVQDSNGTIDVDSLYPGVVAEDAQALILTLEVGYSTVPAGGDGAVSLRVMPDGHNLSSILDRVKVQQLIANSTAIDVVAAHALMPIDPSRRTFFWARQSTDTGEPNKMSLIDMWGYIR